MMEEVQMVRDVVAEVEATIRILEDEKNKCGRAMTEKFEMVRNITRDLEANVTFLEEEKKNVGSVVQLLEAKICDLEGHVMIFKHRFRYFTMTNLTTAILVGVLGASIVAVVSYAF